MSYISILSRITKLSIASPVGPVHQTVRTISSYKPLLFRATPCLYGEPMKKKRKLDPQIVKMREERRKRKLEKQIRRLEKNSRQLKPIDEIEVPFQLLDEKKKRTRPAVVLTPQQIDQRELLQKDWARYCISEKKADARNIDRIITSQHKALQELKATSEELYQAALQIDETLVPYSGLGPAATPPIENYNSPDGEYSDVTRKWEN